MTPILDLMHALSYAYRATAVLDETGLYLRWAEAIWQGRVRRAGRIAGPPVTPGSPPQDASADDPRQRVARAITYYTHHQSRMNYPEYLRLGLPITSSLRESTIKQLSRRMKGTEKFWTKSNVEDILKLQANFLSDSQPLQRVRKCWQEKIAGSNRYKMNV